MTREAVACELLEQYAVLKGNDGEPNDALLTDLLTDLMHFALDEDIDFERALRLAQMHFEAER